VRVTTGPRIGWRRLAAAIAAEIPRGELDRVWLFPPVRQDDHEWGTAVIARRLQGNRRRIYTATYLVVARGRTQGQGRVTVEEVGESPGVIVQDVIAGVQARMADERPPEELAPSAWEEYYGDEPAAEA